MTRDSLVDMNASTSAPSRQVPSKNTINQQQSRPGTKQAAMASKIDDSWSNRCEITKSSNPGEAETAAVVIASKKDSTQPTRVDKKRRFRSPPITANEAIDTKELLGMEAMSPPSHSSSSDDSATTNDRIESIASVFRKKPSSSLSKGLRVEAPIFVPRSVAPSIPRASRLASFDEANTRHSTAVVEHKKSPSSYSIAKGASTFGYYLLEAPNRTPLWAPESMSMSQSRHADIPKNHGRQLKILPPRADSSAVPLYANSSLVTQRHSFIFQGMKVTMVDETTKVFVIDLLLRKECKAIRSMIDEHVAEVTKRGEEAKGWRSLYTYTKMDLPCSEIATMQPVVAMIMRRVVRVVGHVYENIKAASKLKPRSWKEPHFLKYQKKKDLPEHTGIEMHYDGCDITWQLMLSDLSEYNGGGTYIRALRKTLKLRQGQVLVHPGEMYHKGLDIAGGTRVLMVCFMDGFDPGIVDRSDPTADRTEFEENVYMF